MSVINVVVSRKLKVHNLSENINMCTNLGNNLCQLKVILYKETSSAGPATPVPHLALRVENGSFWGLTTKMLKF